MQDLELFILNGIQNHLRCGLLDTLMPAFTRLCDHGELWIVLAAVLLLIRKKRRSGAAVAGALVLDLISCNLLLKPLIGRIRPFMVYPVDLLVEAPLDASFPSGHTAASFAAVFALLAMKDPLWKPALAVAVVMAFSRLYLFVHWPSDVLGGAAVGALCGCGGAWIVRKFSRRHQKNKLT